MYRRPCIHKITTKKLQSLVEGAVNFLETAPLNNGCHGYYDADRIEKHLTWRLFGIKQSNLLAVKGETTYLNCGTPTSATENVFPVTPSNGVNGRTAQVANSAQKMHCRYAGDSGSCVWFYMVGLSTLGVMGINVGYWREQLWPWQGGERPVISRPTLCKNLKSLRRQNMHIWTPYDLSLSPPHHTMLSSKCSILLVSSLNLSPICWRKESSSCWMLLLSWQSCI